MSRSGQYDFTNREFLHSAFALSPVVKLVVRQDVVAKRVSSSPRRRKLLLQLLLSLCWLVPRLSPCQAPLRQEQIDRLADAGRVYGYIKYFHPFLQYKDIDWDSAFAANVEGIFAATSRDEYVAVMRRLLSALDDDMTTVTVLPSDSTAYHARSPNYTIDDSILLVSVNDAPSYAYGNPDNAYDRIEAALRNLNRAKGLIVDMRRPANSTYTPDPPSGQVLDWLTSYFTGDLLMPSGRTMGYLGLNWQSYFKVRTLSSVHGTATRQVPIVFIAANSGQIPLVATVLQEKGVAAILQEEGKQLLPGNSVTMHLADGVLVSVRTDEAVSKNGFVLAVQPDAVYSPNETTSAIIARAKKLISDGFRKPVGLTQYAPMPVTRRSSYPNQGTYPTVGYRMLAAARIFSSIKYFFAGKELMDHDWDSSYKRGIPEFIGAKDSLEYMRAVAALWANIDDSHGWVTRNSDGFSLRLNPIIQGRGSFVPPVITRVIDNKVVVTGIYNDSVSRSVGLNKGDVILSVDGRDAMQLVEDARKYQSASTRASQTFYVASFVLFGQKGQVHRLKTVDAQGRAKDLSMPTLNEFSGNVVSDDYVYRMFSQNSTTTLRMLSKDIGYVNLAARLNEADNDSVVSMLKKTGGVIFDMRGYPHGLGINPFRNAFRKKPGRNTKFFTLAPTAEDVSPNPRIANEYRLVTTYFGDVLGTDGAWQYRGKIVVLTDETAQSWAENVVAELKDCGATIIGSPTAGALASTTTFDIPGQLRLWFSADVSLLPGGKTFQRSGVQPDITVRPTIEGIRRGKDEILQRALRFLETGR